MDRLGQLTTDNRLRQLVSQTLASFEFRISSFGFY